MHDKEEDIVKRLTGRFDVVMAFVQRERRIWATVPRERFVEVLAYLRDEAGFTSLCTVTGLDMGDEFQLIYFLAREDGIVLCAKENAPKTDPVFETATELFKGGVLYELEPRNLLGLTIRGIPDDIRYPLPDSWPEGEGTYPLRKDWVAPEDSSETK
ncbi:MAG: NADH-quinone oxidoreductase subunit C [Defluviitaleaceae bacterium]|nr:NADH-quinone oxidoreductase subunit C [Defluviitaleaceae bacterium]